MNASDSTEKPRILFVCVENSNRSQMAEAFARMLGGDRLEAFSAGSRPSGRVNPKAIDAMAELGYDLSQHRSESIERLPDVSFTAVISMGCGEACPQIPADIREDWRIPDPKALPADEFRVIRDTIREKVRDLLDRLGIKTDE